MLTPKQKRFVQEYLIDSNATQAAIRSGYSKKTASEQASRLLTNVKVSAAVKKGTAKLAAGAKVTAESVIAEMAKIGFSNMQDYMDLSDPEHPKTDLTKLTRDQASVISEVIYERRGCERRLKLKLHDKQNALVNLGKHLGLFSERHLLGGLDGGELKHVHHMEVEFVQSARSK